MASAAAPTANLLQTCAALLMSPYCGMHSPNIEAVLVKIGLQSTHIGLKLIEILLRNCAAAGTDPASESFKFLLFITSTTVRTEEAFQMRGEKSTFLLSPVQLKLRKSFMDE